MYICLYKPKMHIIFFGEADSPPTKPFDMSAKVKVLSFNLLRFLFRDNMLVPRDILLVTFPVVGIERADIQMSKFLHQLFTGDIITFANLEGQHLPSVSTIGIPYPPFAFFAFAYPRPEFIDDYMFKVVYWLFEA